MAASAAPSSWLSDIHSKIKARNARERDAFTLLFDSYTRLQQQQKVQQHVWQRESVERRIFSLAS